MWRLKFDLVPELAVVGIGGRCLLALVDVSEFVAKNLHYTVQEKDTIYKVLPFSVTVINLH